MGDRQLPKLRPRSSRRAWVFRKRDLVSSKSDRSPGASPRSQLSSGILNRGRSFLSARIGLRGPGSLTRGTIDRHLKETGNETNVPTEQPKAPQDAWLPHPHARQRRNQRAQATPRPRSSPPCRLNGPRKSRFEEIFQTGLRASGRLVRLHVLPGTGLVGIATSRDIGTKPRRNTQKRRIREAVRTLDAKEWADTDRVILVKTVCAEAEFKEIIDELAALHGEIRGRWAEGSASS